MSKSCSVFYFSFQMVLINPIDTNTQEVREEWYHVGEKTTPLLLSTLEKYTQASHPCKSNLSIASKVSKTSVKNKNKKLLYN